MSWSLFLFTGIASLCTGATLITKKAADSGIPWRNLRFSVFLEMAGATFLFFYALIEILSYL